MEIDKILENNMEQGEAHIVHKVELTKDTNVGILL